MNKRKHQYTATAATRMVQITIFACSVVFAIGTALHNFAIVNSSLIETMMRMENGANPAEAAPGFTFWFRVIGCFYIVGNAVGMLALNSRSLVLWWIIFAVNMTQASGFVMIPPSMWTAAIEAYGFAGILPSAITDGGALILTIVMLATMIKYRSAWAQRRKRIDAGTAGAENS